MPKGHPRGTRLVVELQLFTMAASALSAAQVANLAKCDTRLVSLLTEFGVAPETMASMGENGLDSVGMLAGIADKREDFRLRVIQFLGLDAANGAADAREVARLICAFESSKIRNEVQIRAQAERASNFLPVRVDMLEVDTARKTMLQVEKGLIDEFLDEVAPGREYYQWRVNQLTSVLETEQLTKVTTLALDERHQVGRNASTSSGNVCQDPTSGMLKVTQKGYTIGYPRDADELRFRLRTLGACWCYMKYKAPHRRCLLSVSMEAWHNYTEWLFGSQVWGLATRDLEGNILSTPKIENVLILDLAIRKSICGHLNAGVDFIEAI